MFAFCSAKPIWIPKKPKEIFHNPASDCRGFSDIRFMSTPPCARSWQGLGRGAISFGGRLIP
jgi:hypothetical protein